MSSTIVVGDLHHGKKHNVTYGDPKIWDKASLDILLYLNLWYSDDKLILLGDVFDSNKPTALDIMELITVLMEFKEVVIIAGNHDIGKVEEDLAFNKLDALPNITIIPYNTVEFDDDIGYVAWQPSQPIYVETMLNMINRLSEGSTIITHANNVYFDNDNDNCITEEIEQAAEAKNITIVSGHQHKASIGKTVKFLGSVVPHAINQVGPRYFMLNGEVKEMPVNHNIILAREEPDYIDSSKCYYIKTEKEVTKYDLKVDAKDLNINILDDFWKAAASNGFGNLKKEFGNEN